MILSDLLCLSVSGILCYQAKCITKVILAKKNLKNCKRRRSQDQKISKSHIKRDLDNLLAQYNRGIISKQQYYDLSNPLIDKLSDLYSDVVWTYQDDFNTVK